VINLWGTLVAFPELGGGGGAGGTSASNSAPPSLVLAIRK